MPNGKRVAFIEYSMTNIVNPDNIELSLMADFFLRLLQEWDCCWVSDTQPNSGFDSIHLNSSVLNDITENPLSQK